MKTKHTEVQNTIRTKKGRKSLTGEKDIKVKHGNLNKRGQKLKTT